MAKIHGIRRRRRSVGKIQQITKAMEKVAASKMRRAQEATLRLSLYAYSAREVLARLVMLRERREHPLFAQRHVRRRLIVLFSSDRGLAGAYNSSLFRLLVDDVAVHQDAFIPQLIVVGLKGALFANTLARAGSVEVVGVYTDWPFSPTSADIRPIADAVISHFTEKRVDRVQLFYTNFISSLRQQAVLRDLLPIDPLDILGKEAVVGTTIMESIFEPSPAEVLTFVVPRLIEVQIYQASLEASASEQSMRMAAMKSASDNAEQLIDDLTLTYNSARQAGITQELAEITTSAEAMR